MESPIIRDFCCVIDQVQRKAKVAAPGKLAWLQRRDGPGNDLLNRTIRSRQTVGWNGVARANFFARMVAILLQQTMEMTMSAPFYLSPKLVALAFGSLLAFPEIALAGSAQRFTFPDAEFMRGDEGLKAARSFAETQLTPGLPIDAAVAKVENAVAACEAPTNAQAVINCEYYIIARPTGGGLDENIWSVKLIPGPDGTLQNAIIERSRVGM